MKILFRGLFGVLVTTVILGSLSLGAVNAQNGDLPEKAYITDMVGYAQSYILSCEARAAVDWAAYFGVYLTENQFLNALPRSDNPEKGFVGDINGYWGTIPPYDYGVHPPPVAVLLRQFGLEASDRSNLSWDDLRREIAAGGPVIVWVIGQMWEGTPQTYQTNAGEHVVVARFEHTMILTGYNSSSATVIDTFTGQTKTFALESFLKSWAVLGNRAILAGIPEPTATPEPSMAPTATLVPTPTPSPTPPSQVIVQPGDTLLGIAQLYNLSWQTLTLLNGLHYPYFIYPGDQLSLR